MPFSKDILTGSSGQSGAAGFYDYQAGNRTPIPSKITQEIINETAEKFAIKQRKIDEDEIINSPYKNMFDLAFPNDAPENRYSKINASLAIAAFSKSNFSAASIISCLIISTANFLSMLLKSSPIHI